MFRSFLKWKLKPRSCQILYPLFWCFITCCSFVSFCFQSRVSVFVLNNFQKLIFHQLSPLIVMTTGWKVDSLRHHLGVMYNNVGRAPKYFQLKVTYIYQFSWRSCEWWSWSGTAPSRVELRHLIWRRLRDGWGGTGSVSQSCSSGFKFQFSSLSVYALPLSRVCYLSWMNGIEARPDCVDTLYSTKEWIGLIKPY